MEGTGKALFGEVEHRGVGELLNFQPASPYHRVNVEGVVALLTAAQEAGVKRVIHTSSIASVGTLPGEECANEETPFNNWETADHYVLSKYMGELEAMKFNLAMTIDEVLGVALKPASVTAAPA